MQFSQKFDQYKSSDCIDPRKVPNWLISYTLELDQDILKQKIAEQSVGADISEYSEIMWKYHKE